jgi:hypothetical protein
VLSQEPKGLAKSAARVWPIALRPEHGQERIAPNVSPVAFEEQVDQKRESLGLAHHRVGLLTVRPDEARAAEKAQFDGVLLCICGM